MPERTSSAVPGPTLGDVVGDPSWSSWSRADPATAADSWGAFDPAGSWRPSGDASVGPSEGVGPTAAAAPVPSANAVAPDATEAAARAVGDPDAAEESARRLSGAMRLLLARAPRLVAMRVGRARAAVRLSASAGRGAAAGPSGRRGSAGSSGAGSASGRSGGVAGSGGNGGGGRRAAPASGSEPNGGRSRGRGALIAWLSAGVVAAGALAFAAGLVISPWSVRGGVDATATPAAAVPGGAHVSTLPAGACLAAFDSAWQARFETVDCAVPHAAQLVGVVAIEGGAYPGADALAREAQLRCQAPSVLAIDRAELLADVVVDVSYPVSAAEWDAGDREYRCFVSRSSGQPIEGSLAATG